MQFKKKMKFRLKKKICIEHTYEYCKFLKSKFLDFKIGFGVINKNEIHIYVNDKLFSVEFIRIGRILTDDQYKKLKDKSL